MKYENLVINSKYKTGNLKNLICFKIEFEFNLDYK